MSVTTIINYKILHFTNTVSIYHIVGNFHWVQFSQMINLYYFAGLIFSDALTQSQYRIAGNFRGVVFADDHQTVTIKPTKKLDCTVHNGCECSCPRNLNLRNSKDQPSAKIEPGENFPLYGMFCTAELISQTEFSQTGNHPRKPQKLEKFT